MEAQCLGASILIDGVRDVVVFIVVLGERCRTAGGRGRLARTRYMPCVGCAFLIFAACGGESHTVCCHIQYVEGTLSYRMPW